MTTPDTLAGEFLEGLQECEGMGCEGVMPFQSDFSLSQMETYRDAGSLRTYGRHCSFASDKEAPETPSRAWMRL